MRGVAGGLALARIGAGSEDGRAHGFEFGVASVRVRRAWPAGLTDREVDVLRRIAAGDSIQQAAEALFVAPKTVDFHLQNIYVKAAVTTRAGAALFAVQNDLLPS